MRGKHTIVINGRHYDATTGLAVDTPVTNTQHVAVAEVKKPVVTHAPVVHHSAERTESNHLKKPIRMYSAVSPFL